MQKFVPKLVPVRKQSFMNTKMQMYMSTIIDNTNPVCQDSCMYLYMIVYASFGFWY